MGMLGLPDKLFERRPEVVDAAAIIHNHNLLEQVPWRALEDRVDGVVQRLFGFVADREDDGHCR